MRYKILGIIIWLFISGAIIVHAFNGSHPDFKNNGRNSPRFYASPKLHPEHP